MKIAHQKKNKTNKINKGSQDNRLNPKIPINIVKPNKFTDVKSSM